MKPLDLTPQNLGFRCICGHRLPIQQFLGEQASGEWLQKVPMRKQLAALWLYANGRTVDQVSEELSLDYASSAMWLYRKYMDLVSDHQEIVNNRHTVGGDGVECEADEIALRCLAGEKDGEQGVWWLRYIGLVRRGSSKILLNMLEYVLNKSSRIF